MNEKYKNAYNDLELAEKRNEFNNEMKITYNILNTIKDKIGYPKNYNEIKNYNVFRDANLTESDMLTFLYSDFYVLQKNILDIASYILKQNK